MTEEQQEQQPDWNIEASETLLDNWPLRDVLVALTYAATHLLTDHDCDAHGYEELQHAVVAARYHAEILDTQSQSSLSQLMTDEDECIAREQAALETGGTRMRDVCVKKVKAMRRSVAGIADVRTRDAILRRNTILGEVVIELESLTLDQVKTGEM